MFHHRIACLATCNLNQWALDFEGNVRRIISSIQRAKEAGASYRVGPELEVPGYGCEDHFLEQDTIEHSWECIAEILEGDTTCGILCDVGMPVMHRGARYNCRVFLLNNAVVAIRPKQHMANDGNYREPRYFSPWKHHREVQEFVLPDVIQSCTSHNPATSQSTCPIGDLIVATSDATIGCESCEELFTPLAPHIALALNGVDIISNGSSSHHQLRKLHQRMDLMRGATAKCGGVYVYANQRGCDGGRLYYDGAATIYCNGDLLAQGQQFGVEDIEMVIAIVDLDDVTSYRGATSSLREQAASAPSIPVVRADFKLCLPSDTSLTPSPPRQPFYHVPEEEIARGPAAWLWDYLRRSRAGGFLLPLSGGADSSSTAAIVATMSQMVLAAAAKGDAVVVADARRIGEYSEGEPLGNPSDFLGRIFTTVYMGTVNSSSETRQRAASLAQQIGSDHLCVDIDTVVAALTTLFGVVTGRTPFFKADGGSAAENLALQNIQARLRMVLAFFLAQLRPWTRGRQGFLLVLGSANVDEGLRGYLTKYDCSSADINPIGGICKADLKRFLLWGSQHLGYPILSDVARATPTAELEPLREGTPTQSDELDMGMTYEELGIYGRLRKVSRCGPMLMFRRLLVIWKDTLTPTAIAAKVQLFFRFYSMNRHKATTMTPAYHAESYSPDDNRFDHRQFLYNVQWPWQFKRMDDMATHMQQDHTKQQPGRN